MMRRAALRRALLALAIPAAAAVVLSAAGAAAASPMICHEGAPGGGGATGAPGRIVVGRIGPSPDAAVSFRLVVGPATSTGGRHVRAAAAPLQAAAAVGRTENDDWAATYMLAFFTAVLAGAFALVVALLNCARTGEDAVELFVGVARSGASASSISGGSACPRS